MALSGLVLVIVGLLAAACIFYVGASYLLAFLRPAGGLPRRTLAGAAVKEMLTALALLPLLPLWLLVGALYEAQIEGESEGEGEGRQRRPVILLHGLAMNQTNWVVLGRRLAKRGLGPLYGFTYFSPQSVRRSAKHLKRFIEEVCAREDVGRVDIVAHSLGGVVARYYVECLDGDQRVGRLVTIGSPHRGSVLARLGMVPATRELREGSALLADLKPLRPGVGYVSIWSRSDAIVVPPEASIAPAGEDCVFDDLGHLSLLISPRVAEVVADRLSARAEALPG